MPSRPTLHTVAAAAEVSIATVSKVVNGITAGVSEATRLRVENAIQQLGYRPNRLGRGLRTLRHSAIGMAIVDPSPTFLTDPFTTNLVAGLANVLSQHGFGLLIQGVKPGQLEQSLLVKRSDVDGLCTLCCGTPRERRAIVRLLASLGQPLVAFQEAPDAEVPDTCFVRQDDRSGGAALGRRILARGSKRVSLFIANVTWPAVEERILGLRSVLAPAGVMLNITTCDDSRIDDITRAVASHIDREGLPDALVGQNDQIALAAMKLLKSRGLIIPHEVTVYGFNGFAFSAFADPSLTTIRSPAYELGVAGGELLLERLDAGRFSVMERTLPVTFIPGESG
ncbi:LacI family transcriptional regulator [Ancylobacter sp. A5.8]|uniref:LacI family DNA-binding transcriptional regulator n=1 Tax=Ancylobacter gelatini TaxID=2919920 RepID=UPI001F4DD616|nr:LacI family DNA-binding transcriptional regulator [Ancylobacter gelatini]MCJ8144235.1 LacI family transcriptional regulator [Ancylobacter gelatini]